MCPHHTRTRAGDRAPANEVLEAFSRGIQGIVSTVSRTRGMAVFSQELAAVSKSLTALSKGQAAISANQHEVLRRTGTCPATCAVFLAESQRCRLYSNNWR
ncbi:hypothetical protein Esi_0053_0117 [Ectocarpus siliculosus]|uniref:Uncharacterized protein n=1 Tax=Ectocarpus siliculosus TaxID=2880 RepID=D8LPU4_ECTSI|nr:hypothetical protein Esi_0053_0117 [Ectocarpus siliculosus]|eukprot:CBN77399.1 hypothetical protein Esi_0053_0117 [Ectocarpus siliculosus]